MLFSHYDRYQYVRSPLVEVICQLRFPDILSIGAKAPVDFQEAIRQEFPRFSKAQERLAPKRVMVDGVPKMVQPEPITNYNFVSEDSLWKLNLTQNFIALSTLRYQRWEDFAQRLDRPLAQFIQIYHPAFFERVGLRYINAFSRRALGLEGTPWSDLIQPAFLGVMAEPDVDERTVRKCSLDVDVDLALEEGRRMKVHAGPSLLSSQKQDPEVKFILDGDFSAAGNIAPDKVASGLEDLHYHAVRLFRGALTSELHTAMGAQPLV